HGCPTVRPRRWGGSRNSWTTVGEIRVRVEPLFVDLQEAARLDVVDRSGAHGRLDVGAELGNQRFRVEADVVEDLADGVAFDHRVEDHVAAGVEADVHG